MIPPEYFNQIVTGDAKELSDHMPDESIDLIFTDPVYENICDYRWLAETAMRILKPSGALLCWQATSLLASTIKVMEPPMHYTWVLHMQKFGPCYPGKTGICVITQCLWFDKNGTSRTYTKIADWFGAAQGGVRSNNHKWSKPESVITHWMNAFTRKDAIVFDPFSGGGTIAAVAKKIGRNYVAFEMNKDASEFSQARIDSTQAMHPVFLEEQEVLDFTRL